MIQFDNNINFIDLAYMKKQYHSSYNEQTALGFSALKLQRLFASEESRLVYGYSLYIINQYIQSNYARTSKFLNAVKKLLSRAKIQLLDLNAQKLLILEERVFSKSRNIKTLSTNFPIAKTERIGIKFTNANLFKKLNNRFSFVASGQLLVSNQRIIFIARPKNFIFHWLAVSDNDYSADGFTFSYQAQKFTITIHDNETLNNTIQNYLSKVGSKFKQKTDR